MKKTFAYLTITAALAIAPLTFTGCSIMQGRESAGAYTHDKEIAAKITAAEQKPASKQAPGKPQNDRASASAVAGKRFSNAAPEAQSH